MPNKSGCQGNRETEKREQLEEGPFKAAAFLLLLLEGSPSLPFLGFRDGAVGRGSLLVGREHFEIIIIFQMISYSLFQVLHVNSML